MTSPFPTRTSLSSSPFHSNSRAQLTSISHGNLYVPPHSEYPEEVSHSAYDWHIRVHHHFSLLLFSFRAINLSHVEGLQRQWTVYSHLVSLLLTPFLLLLLQSHVQLMSESQSAITNISSSHFITIFSLNNSWFSFLLTVRLSLLPFHV